MYIREIVLQGFKTYQNRTVIADFDSQFNAITGFNGSGKSNILDAIQFVLGSTSKQMLRLKTNLSQLIYKDGYAGISKASVSITFICPDKDSRPSGYEDCQKLVVNRQISKQRQSKFFINGTTSTLNKVKGLFRTVHLNIQNPHFLVKQGQITKIINLKPTELLAMLEQTAGTAYYNRTRLDSAQTMKKKQQKLRIINEMLASTIQPQMKKQRKQRDQLQAYRAGQIRLKQINKDIKCYQYLTKKTRLTQLQLQNDTFNQNFLLKKDQRTIILQESTNIQTEIKTLRSKISNFNTIQYHQAKNDLQSKENEKQHLKKRVQQFMNELETLQNKQKNYLQQNQRISKQIQWNQQTIARLQRDVQRTKQMLKEMTTNQKKPNNKSDLLNKQCSQYQNKFKELEAQQYALKQKKQTLRIQCETQKQLQKQLKLKSQNIHHNLAEINKQIQILQKIQRPKPLQDSSFIQSNLNNQAQQLRRLYDSAIHLKLNYKDPSKDFDRTKVKGKVFMLFRVRQKIFQKAVQVGGGGRLYNIVSDNQHTSKLLMDQRSFGSNVTIMPNSKMTYKKLSDQIKNQATKIAETLGGLALPAHQTILFSKQVQNTILNVFGNWFICSNAEIAKKIAYNNRRQYRARCVTYDGDIMDPVGTLTGGYYNNSNFILPKYEQMIKLENQHKQQLKKYEQIRKKQEQYKLSIKQYDRKRKDLEDLIIRRQKLQQRLSKNRVKLEKDYEQEMSDIAQRINDIQKDKSQLMNIIKNLRNDILKGNEDFIFKQQQKKLQHDLKDQKNKLRKFEQNQSRLQLQLQQKQKQSKQTNKSIIQLQQDINKINAKQKNLVIQLNKLNRLFNEIQQRYLEAQKDQITTDSKLKELCKQFENEKKKLEQIEQQLKKMQTRLKNIKQQMKQLNEDLSTILKQNEWIQQQKIVFSRKLDQFNYNDSLMKFDQIKSEQEILKKSINFSAEINNEKTEKDFKDLLEKRSILDKDKSTLLQNINDLDYKRKQTLQKCFIKVRDNLQKILTDLLPGAVARLRMIDHSDITQGCELEVQFNGCKKSLTQLSGGQRSLLALSFILSLLLYKPCPFYILDQIDSALDQSHTENIGYMISQRFPQSQFIIISLKDGMFNNANVLYRVSFMDGQSKVERQALKK